MRRVFRLMGGKRAVEREVDDEIAFHLEMRARKLMDQGLSFDDAQREALRQFGDLRTVRERCVTTDQERERTVRRTNYLTELRQDVWQALRVLRNNPGFAVTVILMLALGIGANTAIFTLVDAVLLRTLPVRDPQELVTIGDPSRTTSYSYSTGPQTSLISYPMYRDLRADTSVVHGLLASGTARWMNLVVDSAAQEPEHARGRFVSGNYFATLGIRAVVGRTFDSSADETIGGTPEATISHAYWMRRFQWRSLGGRSHHPRERKPADDRGRDTGNIHGRDRRHGDGHLDAGDDGGRREPKLACAGRPQCVLPAPDRTAACGDLARCGARCDHHAGAAYFRRASQQGHLARGRQNAPGLRLRRIPGPLPRTCDLRRAAPDAHGRCRGSSPHRLRQRREPAPRAVGRACPGDDGARRDRRRALPHRPPAPDRGAPPGAARRRRWTRPGVVRESPPSRPRLHWPRHDTARRATRPPGPRLHGAGVGARGRALWPGPRTQCLACRPGVGDAVARALGDGEWDRTAWKPHLVRSAAHRWPGRALARPSRGLGVAGPVAAADPARGYRTRP